MPWNKFRYEQGVRDALHIAETDGIDAAIKEHDETRDVGEYQVGLERGVRRVLIDQGQWARCAQFVIDCNAEKPIAEGITKGIESGDLKWVVDPVVRAVVGLFLMEPTEKCVMVVYLEDADFEESLTLLEWLDDHQ